MYITREQYNIFSSENSMYEWHKTYRNKVIPCSEATGVHMQGCCIMLPHGNTGIGTRPTKRATAHYWKRRNVFVSCLKSHHQSEIMYNYCNSYLMQHSTYITCTCVTSMYSHYHNIFTTTTTLKYNHHHHHTVQIAMCAYSIIVHISKCASAPRKNTTSASCSRWWPPSVQVQYFR